MDKMSGECSLC